MFTVTIGCQPRRQFETRFAAGNEVQQGRCHHAANDLRDDIRRHLLGRKPAADHQAHGDRRVEVTAADMANGKCHGQHGKPEGQRYTQQADSDIREGCGQNGTPAATQHQPKRTQPFRNGTSEQRHERVLLNQRV